MTAPLTDEDRQELEREIIACYDWHHRNYDGQLPHEPDDSRALTWLNALVLGLRVAGVEVDLSACAKRIPIYKDDKRPYPPRADYRELRDDLERRLT